LWLDLIIGRNISFLASPPPPPPPTLLLLQLMMLKTFFHRRHQFSDAPEFRFRAVFCLI